MKNYGVFDRWSATYDKSVQDGWIHDKYCDVIDFLACRIKRHAGSGKMRLLDVGAGTGNLLSRLGSSGFELWAIEPSSGMLEKLLEKCRGVHLLEGELPELPSFGMKFDCIVSSYAIHHVEHSKTRTMIESMCRNLGPGGLLLLADVMFESRPALEKHLADLEELGMMDRIEEILDEPFQFVDELADCLAWLGKKAQIERFSFYSFCIMAK